MNDNRQYKRAYGYQVSTRNPRTGKLTVRTVKTLGSVRNLVCTYERAGQIVKVEIV